MQLCSLRSPPPPCVWQTAWTSMRVHVRPACTRPGSFCISSKQSGGAPAQRASRAAAHASWMSPSPPAPQPGPSIQPPAPWRRCPACVRSPAGSSAADEPGQWSSPGRTTWEHTHPTTRNKSTGAATVSAGCGGRAEAHDTRELWSHQRPRFCPEVRPAIRLSQCARVDETSTLFTVKLILSTQVKNERKSSTYTLWLRAHSSRTWTVDCASGPLITWVLSNRHVDRL